MLRRAVMNGLLRLPLCFKAFGNDTTGMRYFVAPQDELKVYQKVQWYGDMKFSKPDSYVMSYF